MKQKDVLLKTGKTITLWLNETTNQWTANKKLAYESRPNFQKYITEAISTIHCTNSQRTSILEYYEKTSDINKTKIKEMINQDIKKVELVHNIILESLINKKLKQL